MNLIKNISTPNLIKSSIEFELKFQNCSQVIGKMTRSSCKHCTGMRIRKEETKNKVWPASTLASVRPSASARI